MNIIFQFDCENIDWERAALVMRESPLADRTPEDIRKAFEGSQVVVFAMEESYIVAMGRALTDGHCQGVIYDMCVHPKYQRQGLGSMVLDQLLKRLPKESNMLFAVPGRESFYEFFGFDKMHTAMIKLSDDKRERMRAQGYIAVSEEAE